MCNGVKRVLNQKRHIASNPFTPKSGMEPRVFLGREEAINTFEKSIQKAQKGYFDHFVILGGWGIGKTTLLKEYRKMAQSNGILSSFFPVREFTNNDLLHPVIQVITQIPRNLPTKKERFNKYKDYLSGMGISFPVIGGGLQFPDKYSYTGDPQVLLLESLLRLWREIKQESEIVFILIDDAQNLKNVPEFMTILKNVLSDDEIINNTGFFFILSSIQDWWRQFMKKHHPIGRYFKPAVRLNNLEIDSVREIINKILNETGVQFPRNIIENIYEYSEGHPFQLQVICDHLYENQMNGRITNNAFYIALENTLQELGEIILDNLYQKASEKEKLILFKMAENYRQYDSNDLSEKLNGTIEKNEIRTMLLRLTKKDIIKNISRGKYAISSRILSEYIIRK